MPLMVTAATVLVALGSPFMVVDCANGNVRPPVGRKSLKV